MYVWIHLSPPPRADAFPLLLLLGAPEAEQAVGYENVSFWSSWTQKLFTEHRIYSQEKKF